MNEQDMENLDSNEKSNHNLISTETLEGIRDGSQTHPTVNKTEARYKICDRIKQKKSEWKGALKATRSMGKGFNAPFHSDCLCLILSHILKRASLLLTFGWF